MDRNMFEAGLAAKKEEMVNEAHEEALKMDKDRDQLLSEMEEKKKKLAEIEGQPEAGKENRESEKFKTWRIVELGTGLKTAADFEKALKVAECKISEYALQGLKEVEKEIAAAKKYEKRKVELVDATPAELGLPEGGTLEQIYEAAKKNGLEECPMETGPQSAIQYKDQPNGDYHIMGMEPFIGSGGLRRVFSVDRDANGRRFLDAYCVSPGNVWFPGLRCIFVRRKKSELESQNL